MPIYEKVRRRKDTSIFIYATKKIAEEQIMHWCECNFLRMQYLLCAEDGECLVFGKSPKRMVFRDRNNPLERYNEVTTKSYYKQSLDIKVLWTLR